MKAKKRTHGRNLEGGTEAETLMDAVHLLALSACFLIQHRTAFTRAELPTVDSHINH